MGKGRSSGNTKSGGRNAENNRIYAHPLPIAFPKSSLFSSHVLGILGLSNWVLDKPQCIGVLHPDTASVWITNTRDAMILWQRGFFGKGSLSRSEPTWLARQTEAYRTAEQLTAQRREARKLFKQERARAIEKAALEAEKAFAAGLEVPLPVLPQRPGEVPNPGPNVEAVTRDDEEEEQVENLEHLQLSLQEAFFLLWAMDCLTLVDQVSHTSLSLSAIWSTFLRLGSTGSPSRHAADNRFLINYVVYHHFRSLGWVVRGGLKFCVDYLLYKRGPVFSHAEFALVICPVYEDAEGQATSEPFTWSWLSTLNRVNSQVQKSLILVFVTVPSLEHKELESPACLSRFAIHEVPVRRFIPARMRD